ncbi:MAG: type I 3-dehydroquinate dehydratase [Collinsella sp.]
MQQILREHQTYPPNVVASITSWEVWKTLKGKDLKDQCDWVELRVDALPAELAPEQVMEFRPDMPLLVTVRCHEEGGLRRMPEEERFSLLRAYMPYATAIDIEIKSMRQRQRTGHGSRRPRHPSSAPPMTFKSRRAWTTREQEKKARAYRADIVKFAFTPCVAGDIQTGVQLFKIAERPHCRDGHWGPMGPVSRLLDSQLGSCLVYGYLGDREAAPGQWHVSLIKETLRNLGPILR